MWNQRQAIRELRQREGKRKNMLFKVFLNEISSLARRRESITSFGWIHRRAEKGVSVLGDPAGTRAGGQRQSPAPFSFFPSRVTRRFAQKMMSKHQETCSLQWA
jgi:hypothetical protein